MFIIQVVSFGAFVAFGFGGFAICARMVWMLPTRDDSNSDTPSE